MQQDRVGPELRALLATRRWLVTMLTTVLVTLSALRAVLSWESLSSFEHVAVVAALACVGAGFVAGKRPGGLWFCLAGPFVLLLTSLLAPLGSPPWIAMPNVVTYSVGFAVLLVPRRVGILVVAFIPLSLGLVVLRDPTNAVAGPLELAGGLIVIVQVVATAGALGLAWQVLLQRAQSEDAQFEEGRRRVEASLAQQERARIWRETASRIHESVLNTIRYALTADVIDAARLARELQWQEAVPESASGPRRRTVDDLLSAVLSDPVAAAVVRVPVTQAKATLEAEVFEAARAGIVEAARNAGRHGGATTVDLDLEVAEPGMLTIRATDNGSGLLDDHSPGFGFGAVLAGSLHEVGGTAAVAPAAAGGTVVTVVVPVIDASPQPRLRRRGPYAPFDRGRLLLSAPLAAACIVGIAYYFTLLPVAALDRTGGVHFWLTVVCGVAGAVSAAAVVLRRSHLRLLAGTGLVLLPALVPWFLRTADYGCDVAANLSAVLNITGFAVIAIALWSGVLPGVVGILTWAAGILVVASGVPVDCRQSVIVALANSLVIIPIAIIVAFVGLRADQRAADRVEAARRRELVEQSRAHAELDLNGSLYGSIEEAMALLSGLPDGQPVDPRVRERLAVVDARIRVAIQVGAGDAGGLASFAQRAVEAASAVGRPVQVRSVAGSSDAEPVPTALAQRLTDAMVATTTGQPLLQVFTDGQCDYLSIMVDEAGLAAAGLAPGESLTFGTAELQAMADDDEAPADERRYSLLVTRPLAPLPTQAHAAPAAQDA